LLHKPKEKNHLQDTVIDGRIILNQVFRKKGGFKWVLIGKMKKRDQ